MSFSILLLSIIGASTLSLCLVRNWSTVVLLSLTEVAWVCLCSYYSQLTYQLNDVYLLIWACILLFFSAVELVVISTLFLVLAGKQSSTFANSDQGKTSHSNLPTPIVSASGIVCTFMKAVMYPIFLVLVLMQLLLWSKLKPAMVSLYGGLLIFAFSVFMNLSITMPYDSWLYTCVHEVHAQCQNLATLLCLEYEFLATLTAVTTSFDVMCDFIIIGYVLAICGVWVVISWQVRFILDAAWLCYGGATSGIASCQVLCVLSCLPYCLVCALTCLLITYIFPLTAFLMPFLLFLLIVVGLDLYANLFNAWFLRMLMRGNIIGNSNHDNNFNSLFKLFQSHQAVDSWAPCHGCCCFTGSTPTPKGVGGRLFLNCHSTLVRALWVGFKGSAIVMICLTCLNIQRKCVIVFCSPRCDMLLRLGVALGLVALQPSQNLRGELVAFYCNKPESTLRSVDSANTLSCNGSAVLGQKIAKSFFCNLTARLGLAMIKVAQRVWAWGKALLSSWLARVSKLSSDKDTASSLTCQHNNNLTGNNHADNKLGVVSSAATYHTLITRPKPQTSTAAGAESALGGGSSSNTATQDAVRSAATIGRKAFDSTDSSQLASNKERVLQWSTNAHVRKWLSLDLSKTGLRQFAYVVFLLTVSFLLMRLDCLFRGLKPKSTPAAHDKQNECFEESQQPKTSTKRSKASAALASFNNIRVVSYLSKRGQLVGQYFIHLAARITYFFNEWVLSTNHRKIAIMYFLFVAIAGFTGLILATIIRLELAYPGQFFLTNNAERYLTVISLHGIVMVFFMIIPVIFGAFGNFLLPTQLGIRDVAFPRLNSFMFWVTPAGFVMLLHILMFDKAYQLTYWINYSELKAQLRRRYSAPQPELIRYHKSAESSILSWRLANMSQSALKTRNMIIRESAPQLEETGVDVLLSVKTFVTSAPTKVWNWARQGASLTTELVWKTLVHAKTLTLSLINTWRVEFSTEGVYGIIASTYRLLAAVFNDVVIFGLGYKPVFWSSYATFLGYSIGVFSALEHTLNVYSALVYGIKLIRPGHPLPQNGVTWNFNSTFQSLNSLAEELLTFNYLITPVYRLSDLCKSLGKHCATSYPQLTSYLVARVLCLCPWLIHTSLKPALDTLSLLAKNPANNALNTNVRVFNINFGSRLRRDAVEVNTSSDLDVFASFSENRHTTNAQLASLSYSHEPKNSKTVLASSRVPFFTTTKSFGDTFSPLWGLRSLWVSSDLNTPANSHNFLIQTSAHLAFTRQDVSTFLSTLWLDIFSSQPIHPLSTYVEAAKRHMLKRLITPSQTAVDNTSRASMDVINQLYRYHRFSEASHTRIVSGIPALTLRGLTNNLTNNLFDAPVVNTSVYRSLYDQTFNLYREFAFVIIVYNDLFLKPLLESGILQFYYSKINLSHAWTPDLHNTTLFFVLQDRLLSDLIAGIRSLLNLATYKYFRSLAFNQALQSLIISRLNSVLSVILAIEPPIPHQQVLKALLYQDVIGFKLPLPGPWWHILSNLGLDKLVELNQLGYLKPITFVLSKIYESTTLLPTTTFELNNLLITNWVVRFKTRAIWELSTHTVLADNYPILWAYISNLHTPNITVTSDLIDQVVSDLVQGKFQPYLDSLLVFTVRKTYAMVAHVLEGVDYFEAICVLYLWPDSPYEIFTLKGASRLISNLIADGTVLVNTLWSQTSTPSCPAPVTLATWRGESNLKSVARLQSWVTDSNYGVLWPQTNTKLLSLSSWKGVFDQPLSSEHSAGRFLIATAGELRAFALSLASSNLTTAQALVINQGAAHSLFDLTTGYCLSLWRADYINDWRELKLEREIWRSIDSLSSARHHLLFRKKYYSNFYEPSSLVNKVSTWMPNHLLPGWAFVTPYSSRLRYTALGKVDVALIVVFAASLGSVFSSVNYVITYRYIGAPTLKNRRELRSFFVDALLVASRMMILANPALLIGILLLLSDRHFNTSVFDFSGGGDTILFQHLFWFFGHPEVYIVIIPCFGIMNSLLPYYLRKRLSGRLSLQFSMYTIAFMSFAVWGHHLYMVGLANSVRTLYSTMTVMISVPASTKVIHWCVTLIQSTLSCDVGFLFLMSFMYFFVLGGLSGMFVAHIGFDTIFHDTFYVIGHFHVMFAGSAMCCVFAAFYFYFPAIFGVRYSKVFAYLHYAFYMAGQLLTLIPMFWLGYAGMPRRIMDYPSTFGGWHSIISSGHLLTVTSFGFFLLMLADSFYEGRAPISKTKGVSRLNTRLSFFIYESRKLQAYRTKSLTILKPQAATRSSRGDLYRFCWTSEMANFEYTFDFKPTGPVKQNPKSANASRRPKGLSKGPDARHQP